MVVNKGETLAGEKYRVYCNYNNSLIMVMMMMMMCNDLVCTYMLTRSQLSLTHSAKVKTDMPEKNEKQLESTESVRWMER